MKIDFIDRKKLLDIDEIQLNIYVVLWALSHEYDRIYLTKDSNISGIVIPNSSQINKVPKIMHIYDSIEYEQYLQGNLEKYFNNTNQAFIPVIDKGQLMGELKVKQNYKPKLVFDWSWIDAEVSKEYIMSINQPRAFMILDEKTKPFFELCKKWGISTLYVKELNNISIQYSDIQKSVAIYSSNNGSKTIYKIENASIISIEYIYCQLLFETILKFYKKNNLSYHVVKVADYNHIPEYIKKKLYKKDIHEFYRDKEAIEQFYGKDENRLYFDNGDYLKCRTRKRGLGVCMTDAASSTYNVIDGKRITIGNPKEYICSVHLYGPCIVTGGYVSDQSTISSYLQKSVNEQNNNSVRVLNCGVNGTELFYILYSMLMDTYQKGDIVFHFTGNVEMSNFVELYKDKYNIKILELLEPFNEENTNKPCFINNLFHTLSEGNRIIASYLYDTMKENIPIDKIERQEVRIMDRDYLWEYDFEINQLQQYKNKLKIWKQSREEDKKIGSIVMNCNPFTLGHLYLIEESLRYVDYLYIFVVEEDKSFFPFQERFQLVKNNCRKYPNIRVIPSGKFILSMLTFPEYFYKEQEKDAIISPVQDIILYGKEIAPILNINYRFIGEEPIDLVTAQYNEYLKQNLGQYGIKVIEIPRKEIAGNVISASYIRKCIHENRIEDTREYLPEMTYLYLLKKFEKN